MPILVFALILLVLIISLFIAAVVDWNISMKAERLKCILCGSGAILCLIVLLASIIFIGDTSLYTPYETQEVTYYFVNDEVIMDGYLYIENEDGSLWKQDKEKFEVIRVEKKESDDELDKITINTVKARYGMFTIRYDELIIYK